MCDFCSHEEETLLHLFLACPAFCSDVSVLIGRDMQVELNMPLFLFGFGRNVQTDRAFDPYYFEGKISHFQIKTAKGKTKC